MPVRLGTADWGRARDQSNASGEGACVASGVAAVVIGKPLDCLGHSVHLSVAMLDRGDHQFLDVLCGDAARSRHVSYRLAVAAVERERDTHFLTMSEVISNPSEHQRVLRRRTATRPS
jgi:hypothetical protein